MSKFKVSDWVTRIEDNVTKQILSVSENYYDVGEFIFDKDQFTYKLWQPKEGEWCWFHMHPPIGRYPVLMPYGEQDISMWDIIEPFIGTLPSFIKA